MRRTLAAALTAMVTLGWFVAPATADEPIEVEQQITDEADVLGDRQADVLRALDQFFDRTGDRMYVVYVPSFDDLTPAEWAKQTADKSTLGPAAVVLMFATKNRSFGHFAPAAKFTADGVARVDAQQIQPALHNDDYAKATIEAADAYGDLAVARRLPWGWIFIGIWVALIALWIITRRNRRRFEHTHHVLDEHGNPVDPADILTLDEINKASAAALVAVDDALLTSALDADRAAQQDGPTSSAAAVADFAAVVAEGRAVTDDAFRRRRKLDKLIAKGRADEATERKWRKRASRILAACEEVDASLDGQTKAFDLARDLRNTADGLLDALAPQIGEAVTRIAKARETYALLPTRAAGAVSGNVELANNLLRAAARQIEKRNDRPPIRVRAVEDALSTANELLDAVDEAKAHENDSSPTPESVAWRVAATEQFVSSRRGAVGVNARTYRSEARRLLTAALAERDANLAAPSLSRASRFAELGLKAATEDVAAWRRGRDASDDPFSNKFDALVLAGVLVDETDSGGLKTLLGGSSHGGGSGARYRGIEKDGTLRTAGSFGGTTTRGRWGGF